MRLRLRYEVDKAVERFWFWLAWSMPRKLVYFCAIRLGAHGTTGVYGHLEVPELTYLDVLKHWNETPKQANERLDVLGLDSGA